MTDAPTVPNAQNLTFGLIVLALGAVVLWLLKWILPAALDELLVAAVTGGAGVVAVSRMWPGLPFSKVHLYAGVSVLYGIVLSLV